MLKVEIAPHIKDSFVFLASRPGMLSGYDRPRMPANGPASGSLQTISPMLPHVPAIGTIHVRRREGPAKRPCCCCHTLRAEFHIRSEWHLRRQPSISYVRQPSNSYRLRFLGEVPPSQVNGNMLGWAGGRAIFRTVNSAELPRTIGIRDCDLSEGDLNAFDPRFPGERSAAVLPWREGSSKDFGIKTFAALCPARFGNRKVRYNRAGMLKAERYRGTVQRLCWYKPRQETSGTTHARPPILFRPLSVSVDSSCTLSFSSSRSLPSISFLSRRFAYELTGGTFDLDLSCTSQRATAQEIILAASFCTGCRLTELEYFEPAAENAGRGSGGGGDSNGR